MVPWLNLRKENWPGGVKGSIAVPRDHITEREVEG